MSEMRVESEVRVHSRLASSTIDVEMIGVGRTAMLTIALLQRIMAGARCLERFMRSEDLCIPATGIAATTLLQAHRQDLGVGETNLHLPLALLEKCSNRDPRVRRLRIPTTVD
jgi:hypothetical protein